MQKVVVRGAGGPEVLHVVSARTPAPRRGQVRVRVEVAGVAFGDVMRRRGVLAPPWSFTPGYDIVGIIEAVGRGVDPAVCGQRVVAMMPSIGFGGYATHVCLPAGAYVPVPDGVEPVNAVGLGLNYITAWQVLHRLIGAQRGQRILVHGAAGGVGTAVLQLGQRLGVQLVGTASAPKHPILARYGAEAIDYRSEDFVERLREAPVDAVLDPIGGPHLARSDRVLRPGGVLVSFGISGDLSRGMWSAISASGVWLRVRLSTRNRLRLYLIATTPGSSAETCRHDWAALLAMHTRGEVSPHIGAQVPLAEVRRAHDLLDRAAVVGKVVLTMP